MVILVLLPLLSIAVGFGVVAAIVFILLIVPLHRITMYIIKRNGGIPGPSALNSILPGIEANLARSTLESNFQNIAQSSVEDESKVVDLEIGTIRESFARNEESGLEDESGLEKGQEAVFEV